MNLNDVITFYAIDIDDDPSPAAKKEDYATKRYYAELQTLKKSLEKNETQISSMTEQMEDLTKKLSNSEQAKQETEKKLKTKHQEMTKVREEHDKQLLELRDDIKKIKQWHET